MAVFFTVFYVFVVYVTPETVFGPLSDYHMVTLLALIATAVSIPNIMSSGVLKQPQAWACLAFAFMVPVSIAAGGWFGGAVGGLYTFLPAVLAFFLAASNFRTRQHLQWMVLAMLVGSTFFVYSGVRDVMHAVFPSPFVYGEGLLRRIRGLGFVFDPNDLAQVLVSLIPLTFLWRSKTKILNVVLVGVPVAILVTGMFFTHSRGAAVALMAILALMLRRRIGTIPAAAIAGGLFAVSLAVGWSGGRDVSMEAGADRLDAWSMGLQFIKTHPIFGLGAGRFSDFYYITAHNSVIVCAAEIGLPGFVCWILFVFTSLRTAGQFGEADLQPAGAALTAAGTPPVEPLKNARPRRFLPALIAGKDEPGRAKKEPLPATRMARLATAGTTVSMQVPLRSASRFGSADKEPERVVDVERQEEVKRMARLLLAALVGFLTAGWFLSRALSTWLFLYCGMVVAVGRMGREAGLNPKLEPFSLLLRRAVMIAIGLLAFVYILLRVRSITGR